MVTPPRSAGRMNSVPPAPPRRRRRSPVSPPPTSPLKIDRSHQTPQKNGQLPEQNKAQDVPFFAADNTRSNGISSFGDEQAQRINNYSSKELSMERVALLPDDCKSKKSSRPSTPSSSTSSSSASRRSSRYSPAASLSRSPPSTRSTQSSSSISSSSLPSIKWTPPSALSYKPLSPPSSSQVRQMRKLPPMPFPTMNSSASNTTKPDPTEYIIGGHTDIYNDDDNKQVIMARLAAKEQYQQQKQRLRQLFQQKVNLRKPNRDGVVDASIRSQHRNEHEIVIHPESLEGTIESASLHLHGQTGGRKQSPNPDFKNAAVMNGDVLRSIKVDERNEDVFEDNNIDTNVRIDSLEKGFNVISGGGGGVNRRSHQDFWSTGVAAAIVMGTASRYHKTFFMFPHGRKIILPIIMGMLALSLSIVTLKSCRFMTILPDENNHQVFQLGTWNYLSPGKVYDGGEVCLPYPSTMEIDTPIMVARMASLIASCLGGGLLLLTTTMMCIPYGKPQISLLGLGYILSAILQGLTTMFYLTNNCKGGGYFSGTQCEPNQDLVFCVAASLLYLACGWILYMVQQYIVTPPGHASSQIYTWSAKSKSSNERKGILRTVERAWTKLESGHTLMATVFVEKRIDRDGKMKTTHSVQTDIVTDD